MPYIKKQNIKYNDDKSRIISGTAAVAESVYDPKKTGHNRKVTVESLGKVIYLRDDNKEGIFLSPTRGLIVYNSEKNSFSAVERDDPRLDGHTELFPVPEIHTIIGDAYLFLKYMERIKMLEALRTVFPKDREYERCLCHILHTVLKNGSRKSCDDFVEQSFISHLFSDIPIRSLESDSMYFTMMGKDSVRVSFFRTYVELMRKKNPRFGKASYVDSTPLPNDIQSLVTNALCSHGVAQTSNQTRMVLVLDEKTDLPVWYSLIPGNVLDLQTLESVHSDVLETLDVQIRSYVLDAGYLTKKIIMRFNLNTELLTDDEGKPYRERILAKMPAKKGFPYKELYNDYRPFFSNVEYHFDREGHTYFGIKEEVTIFGCRINAYVYVDFDNAFDGIQAFRDKYPQEYEEMSLREKDWATYKSGYFVLLANEDDTAENMLNSYYGRTRIEEYFKTMKDFTDLLPLRKWNRETVYGKILNDIISSMIFIQARALINSKGKAATKLISKTQSLMCTNKRNGDIRVEEPNKQVRELYEKMDVKIPSHIHTESFMKNVIGITHTR
ncbi:MAG: transposase [Solobacterium sp.]|nr:transposase [Solobacterium sp.]